MTHPSSFAEQRILVTAGGSGIGHAIVVAFAEAGAKLHVVDIDEQSLAMLNNSHPDIYTTSADVAEEDAVEQVFDRQQNQFGGIDVLVNCAGIAGPTALLEDIPLKEWQRCLAVNLDATFLCCRKAIPLMRIQQSNTGKDGGKGNTNIINISSTAGWHGYPLRTPYASAKWALIGLTKSIAMELGPVGIRANAICPGSIVGARMDRVIAAEATKKKVTEEQVRQKYTDGVSMRTFINAEDIANTALFLASSAAEKITGQAITVDGHIENVGGMDQ